MKRYSQLSAEICKPSWRGKYFAHGLHPRNHDPRCLKPRIRRSPKTYPVSDDQYPVRHRNHLRKLALLKARHHDKAAKLIEKWESLTARAERKQENSRFQAAFRQWLDDNADIRSALIPVRNAAIRTDETDLAHCFQLCGVSPTIQLTCFANSSYGYGAGTVSIVAYWNGIFWDMIEFECLPKKKDGGHVDSYNLPEYQIVYPTLNTLWEFEVFEEFRRWWRDKFSQCISVNLAGRDEGSTWFRFVRPDQPTQTESEFLSLPVRQTQKFAVEVRAKFNYLLEDGREVWDAPYEKLYLSELSEQAVIAEIKRLHPNRFGIWILECWLLDSRGVAADPALSRFIPGPYTPPTVLGKRAWLETRTIKVFLDDKRPTPDGWIRAYWPEGMIHLLKSGRVAEISLDHDLGDDASGTGYDVLLWIEKAVATKGFVPPKITVHSANPAARLRMEQALASIERLMVKGHGRTPISYSLVPRRV